MILLQLTQTVENYFGNLDHKLKSSGARGFKKSVDDLVIKYSEDLLKSGEFKWREKHVKQIAKDLKQADIEFSQTQKDLMITVSEQEAQQLTAENQLIKVVSKAKESHNGPLCLVEELHSLVDGWKGSEKALHTALNLEIRFRKLSFASVKSSCT